MRVISKITACVALILISMVAGAQQNLRPDVPVAIVGGMLLDGYEAKPIHHSVVVFENGRITAVGQKHDTVIPDNAVVIDADGSGDCTPDDLAAVGQFYGWGSDQRFVADGTEGQDATHGIPVTFERIGASKTWGDRTFCEVYVPTEMLD